ncbi:hypothetical protein CANCADRAFT_56998 [Tortispora caseinolytica NRRL Y-17796]|uniref:Uncharacterized protein n=1 Tax=Tortispora caseinolytica NRRL Y-17796 TaxID=767744 RepID=A0A1E4TFN9_9ASCO|nr:hypothetical protein CANCADRAFT_56998 [Tortispora caseinolytica NRRL Y-17796]
MGRTWPSTDLAHSGSSKRRMTLSDAPQRQVDNVMVTLDTGNCWVVHMPVQRTGSGKATGSKRLVKAELSLITRSHHEQSLRRALDERHQIIGSSGR